MRYRLVFTMDAAAVASNAESALRRINRELKIAGIQECIAANVEMFTVVDVIPAIENHLDTIVDKMETNMRAMYPSFDVTVRIEPVGVMV